MRALDNSTEVARFTYDGLGRRSEKISGGVTRAYVYDGEDIVEERAGGTTTRIVHGPVIDQPLAAVTGSTPTYYLADHLGSIAQHTNSAQQVTLTRSYDPFGNLTSGASTSGYAFTGREWDAEIGLYYYRARYYDAGLGRFISVDPSGFVDGPNLYAYVEGSPANRRDPSGRQWQWVLAGAGAGGGTAALTTGIVSNPVGWILGGIVVVGGLVWYLSESDETSGAPDIPYPGSDPTVAPGPDYEWRGEPGSKPGDKNGSWYNPKTKESLHPDLQHEPPVGPHWDYNGPTGKWRIFPDGGICKK